MLLQTNEKELMRMKVENMLSQTNEKELMRIKIENMEDKINYLEHIVQKSKFNNFKMRIIKNISKRYKHIDYKSCCNIFESCEKKSIDLHSGNYEQTNVLILTPKLEGFFCKRVYYQVLKTDLLWSCCPKIEMKSLNYLFIGNVMKLYLNFSENTQIEFHINNIDKRLKNKKFIGYKITNKINEQYETETRKIPYQLNYLLRVIKYNGISFPKKSMEQIKKLDLCLEYVKEYIENYGDKNPLSCCLNKNSICVEKLNTKKLDLMSTLIHKF